MKISKSSRHIDAEVIPAKTVFLARPHPTPFLTDFSENYVNISSNIGRPGMTFIKFCFIVDHLFLLPPCDQSLGTIENSAIKGTFFHPNLRIDYELVSIISCAGEILLLGRH